MFFLKASAAVAIFTSRSVMDSGTRISMVFNAGRYLVVLVFIIFSVMLLGASFGCVVSYGVGWDVSV
jgi:hypothetical protein